MEYKCNKCGSKLKQSKYTLTSYRCVNKECNSLFDEAELDDDYTLTLTNNYEDELYNAMEADIGNNTFYSQLKLNKQYLEKKVMDKVINNFIWNKEPLLIDHRCYNYFVNTSFNFRNHGIEIECEHESALKGIKKPFLITKLGEIELIKKEEE